MSTEVRYEAQYRARTDERWDVLSTHDTLKEARESIAQSLKDEPPAPGERFRVVKFTVRETSKVIK